MLPLQILATAASLRLAPFAALRSPQLGQTSRGRICRRKNLDALVDDLNVPL